MPCSAKRANESRSRGIPAAISNIPIARKEEKCSSGGCIRQPEIRHGSNPARLPGAITRNNAEPRIAGARFMRLAAPGCALSLRIGHSLHCILELEARGRLAGRITDHSVIIIQFLTSLDLITAHGIANRIWHWRDVLQCLNRAERVDGEPVLINRHARCRLL